jgi:hypothetical protein
MYGTWGTKHIGTKHIDPKRNGDRTHRQQNISATKRIGDKMYRRQNNRSETKRIGHKTYRLIKKILNKIQTF